jgi:hypothetical protein
MPWFCHEFWSLGLVFPAFTSIPISVRILHILHRSSCFNKCTVNICIIIFISKSLPLIVREAEIPVTSYRLATGWKTERSEVETRQSQGFSLLRVVDNDLENRDYGLGDPPRWRR